jgi:hypothetical protein
VIKKGEIMDMHLMKTQARYDQLEDPGVDGRIILR